MTAPIPIRNVHIRIPDQNSLGQGLLGRSGTFAVFNNEYNIPDTAAEFTGTHCTSTLSKVIAYVASFFGIGKILNIHVSKYVASNTNGNALTEGEHTFWVDRNIDQYVDKFGVINQPTPDPAAPTWASQGLTIAKTNTLWFSTMIDIRANCSKEESIAERKLRKLPLLLEAIDMRTIRKFAKFYNLDEVARVISSRTVFEKQNIPVSTQPATKQWASLLMNSEMRALALRSLELMKTGGVDQLLEIDTDLLNVTCYHSLSDELIKTMDFNTSTAAEFYASLPKISHFDLDQRPKEDFIVSQGLLYDLWRIEKLSMTFTTIDSENNTITQTLGDKKAIVLKLFSLPIPARNAVIKCLYQDIAIKFANAINSRLLNRDRMICDISHYYSVLINKDNIEVKTEITATLKEILSPKKAVIYTVEELNKGSLDATYALRLENQHEKFEIKSTSLEAFRITVD